MNWLVQNNLIKDQLLSELEVVTKLLGHNFIGLKIIPFSDSIEFGFPPDFQAPEGKFIPYGSTSMIKLIAKSNLDKRGFFFNHENLRTSTWIRELGDLVLNHDAQIMPLKDAIKANIQGNVFMKPDNDLKDFSGTFVDGAEIEKFYNEVSAGGFTFDTNVPVVLSPKKDFGWEYRMFMIKDKVIASSSYKLKTLIKQNKEVPWQAINFAEKVASRWRPDDVFVMDVCACWNENRTGVEKLYRVIEFNCFNASGFYSCDVKKIVDEVSKFVETR
ncbi:MAG: ATP-grasp domain-containing protein [Candidatus Methanoperedens sp.]|nr:ATP-grasp domain-containing protein [Candidatus Methanoperedens sp.]